MLTTLPLGIFAKHAKLKKLLVAIVLSWPNSSIAVTFGRISSKLCLRISSAPTSMARLCLFIGVAYRRKMLLRVLYGCPLHFAFGFHLHLWFVAGAGKAQELPVMVRSLALPHMSKSLQQTLVGQNAGTDRFARFLKIRGWATLSSCVCFFDSSLLRRWSLIGSCQVESCNCPEGFRGAGCQSGNRLSLFEISWLFCACIERSSIWSSNIHQFSPECANDTWMSLGCQSSTNAILTCINSTKIVSLPCAQLESLTLL
jgi:hypothetical protein